MTKTPNTNESGQNTREKILETALRMFSSKGYLGTTTRELAREAGIAEVTLFRHFASKDQLFIEVFRSNSFLPAIKELIPEIEDLPYEEALFAVASGFLKSLNKRKEIIKILQSEIVRYPEEVLKSYHSFVDETTKVLSAYFVGLQSTGQLRQFDADIAARAFMGMFFAFFNKYELMLGKKYTKIDTDSMIREFINIFVRGTIVG